MISKNIKLFGFKLPPGEFTITIGSESLAIFNKFLDGRFLWAISGIDWTKSEIFGSFPKIPENASKFLTRIRLRWVSQRGNLDGERAVSGCTPTSFST